MQPDQRPCGPSPCAKETHAISHNPRWPILAVGRNLQAGGAQAINARGRVVMPGFIEAPTPNVAVFGYFDSAGGVADNQYPSDAARIRRQHFRWRRTFVGTFGMRPTFDALAAAGAFGPNNLFIHITACPTAPGSGCVTPVRAYPWRCRSR